MALTQTAQIYGFGSFFNEGRTTAEDIDLLLVHDSVERGSIDFAITCKSHIRALTPHAHIVLLSVSEERELAFLLKSKAILLGAVSSVETLSQLSTLLSRYIGIAYPLTRTPSSFAID
jgi:hypothetical protein